MIAQIKEQLETAIAGTAHLNMGDLQAQLETAQQELLDLHKASRGKVTPEAMERATKLMDDVTTLKANIELVEKTENDKCLLEYRLKMIDTALTMSFEKFNADLFKMLIERVIIVDKNTPRFIFKGGTEIEQKIA